MRPVRSFILFTLILLIPVSTIAGPDGVPGEEMVTMEISGMSWILCAPLVKRSLEGVEGVVEAEVSFKKAEARVRVTDTVTDEMLEEAVRSTGRFKGKVISRESDDAKSRSGG